MQKRLVDLTKSDGLNDSDYLFINHDDNPIQVSLPYFKQNVAPVDATLTEEGKAADAKATGDKIDEINTNIETINTEIEGVKTNYATKEELNAVSTSLTETQEDVGALSSSIESVKTNYLTKSDAQSVYLTKEDASTISDKEFYDGRKYDGMTYTGKTSDKGIKLHSVKGKTTQQTTKGYQLFDSSKVETKTSGGATVTNNNDGSFTISGSGNLTETFSNLFNYSKEESLKLLKAGIYKSNVENTTPQIRFGLRNASTMSYVSNKCITSSIKSITLTEEDIQSVEDGTNILSIGFYGSNNNAIVTGTVKPMLYQDGDGTWEQYTGVQPAPNPDYPMPIENVEISNITSHGRQLFDSSKLATKSQGGATVTNNNDGSFTVSGSGNLVTGYEIRTVLDNETSKRLVKSGTINLVATSTNPYLFASFKNNDGTIGEVNVRNNSVSSRELTSEQINSDGFHIELGFWGSKDQPIKTGTIKPMLYQDGNGTWEPYKHGTVETSLTLADGNVYENGVATKVKEHATFDGSSDENWINGSVNDQSLIRFSIIIEGMKFNPSGKCNRFEWVITPTAQSTKEVIGGNPAENRLHVIIKRSRLETEDISGFKKWLQSHPVEVEYELATPTTEELKVPTIPSYYPFTNVSTDCNLETEITWKILADCDNSLKQEELEKRILALETKAIE